MKIGFLQKLILPIGIYVILKIISVAIVYATFEQLFSRPALFYPDLVVYIGCQPTSPNILYSYSICLLNITNLGDIQALTLGVLLNTIKDLAFLVIVYCITNRQTCIIFVFLLSLHPFLALYHPRYVTTLFSSIALLLVFTYEIKDSWIKKISISKRSLVIVSLILVGFRYTNSIIFLLYFTFKNYKNFYLIGLIIILALSFLWFSGNYASEFVNYSINAQTYDLSFSSISDFVKVSNINYVDYIFTIFLYFISHLFTLTGFREAAVLDFTHYFFPLNTESLMHFLVFFSFSIFHIFGILAFCIYFKRYRGLVFCVVMNISIACFFLTHVRYFLHLIPLALLGWSVFINNKILNKKQR